MHHLGCQKVLIYLISAKTEDNITSTMYCFNIHSQESLGDEASPFCNIDHEFRVVRRSP